LDLCRAVQSQGSLSPPHSEAAAPGDQLGHAGAHGTGTVTAVNAAQRKIGMQHEPIPSLGWPAMAMEFAVAPSVNLQGIQPGSRVNFSLERGADGMYVIQSVQPAGSGR
jgi:Cu/Ag efflux protein CusF